MTNIKDWLHQAGDAKAAIDLTDAKFKNETPHSAEAIEAIRKKYAPDKLALAAKLNEARVKLQDSMDHGLIPPQGLETDEWKLVPVKRDCLVLENFDDVPDDLLLPVNQWIDWKKADEYATTNNGAPPGMKRVATYSPRVSRNQKVKL